jgi:predicted DCC family thiol-disulfide oxidoreductase YuxK
MRVVGRAASAALMRRGGGPTAAPARILPLFALPTRALPAWNARLTPARPTSTSATSLDNAAVAPSTSSPQWPSPAASIAMLYDGECPLCMREVDMLRRRDATGKIWFVDVADKGYDSGAGAAFGIPYETAMATIHAVQREESGKGRIISGVEVFQRLYEAVGLGFIYGFLNIPALKAATEAVYRVWAQYRLPLTGRETLDVVLAERKTCKK